MNKNNMSKLFNIKGEEKMKKITELDLKNRVSELLEGYIIDGNEVILTPSGLSVDGKVFSKKDKLLLDVSGTEVLRGFPVGFSFPTTLSDIEDGDIIYDGNKQPFYVLDTRNKNTIKCLCPKDNRSVEIFPTVDIYGNKTFDKLITPFNYDLGCNPLLNVATVVANGIVNDDLDSVVDVLLPKVIKLVSKMNFSNIMKDKRLTTLSPVLLLAYQYGKTNNFKVDMDIDTVKNMIGNIDKKTKILILLGLALLIYTFKDKIAEKLMAEKISNVPVIGKLSEFIASILMKIPTFKNKILDKYMKQDV